MKCEYCDKNFVEDGNCLPSLTMHLLVVHPKQIRAKEMSKK